MYLVDVSCHKMGGVGGDALPCHRFFDIYFPRREDSNVAGREAAPTGL